MVITGWSNIDRHMRHHGIVLSQIQKLIERNCFRAITYQTQNQSGKVRCQYKRIRCVIRIRTPAEAIPCHDCPRLIKMKSVRCDTFGTENSITAMNIGRRNTFQLTLVLRVPKLPLRRASFKSLIGAAKTEDARKQPPTGQTYSNTILCQSMFVEHYWAAL